MSAKDSRLLRNVAAKATVQRGILKIIRFKETSHTAMVPLSKPNKWGESQQCDMKLADNSGTKRWNIYKKKLMSLQHTVRTRALDLYRAINEFKKGFKLRINLVKDENGDLFADSNILNR
jgi:TFIIF-interacting CTD phosphatase-like protein